MSLSLFTSMACHEHVGVVDFVVWMDSKMPSAACFPASKRWSTDQDQQTMTDWPVVIQCRHDSPAVQLSLWSFTRSDYYCLVQTQWLFSPLDKRQCLILGTICVMSFMWWHYVISFGQFATLFIAMSEWRMFLFLTRLTHLSNRCSSRCFLSLYFPRVYVGKVYCLSLL